LHDKTKVADFGAGDYFRIVSYLSTFRHLASTCMLLIYFPNYAGMQHIHIYVLFRPSLYVRIYVCMRRFSTRLWLYSPSSANSRLFSRNSTYTTVHNFNSTPPYHTITRLLYLSMPQFNRCTRRKNIVQSNRNTSFTPTTTTTIHMISCHCCGLSVVLHTSFIVNTNTILCHKLVLDGASRILLLTSFQISTHLGCLSFHGQDFLQ
jgi:hypothetical protein